jgi:hypothetical protein
VINSFSRYPVSQKEYLQKTGRLLAHRIGRLFTELGYKTWICKGQKNGVDLKLFDQNNNLILVAEILNWSPYTEMSNKRKNWIIQSLLEYSCIRLLIYTAMKNENTLKDLSLDSISVLERGYQILPKYFHQHYEARHQVVRRRIDSRETNLHIKSKLMEYLRCMNLMTLSTVDAEQIISNNN